MAYEKPTTYTIKSLDLITHENKAVSLVNLLISLKFTEDIYTPVIHGNLTIQDTFDLQQIAPLIGEEYIRFVYNTNSSTNTIERLFRVFRVETSNDNSQNMGHILHLVSPEAFSEANTTISKSYKNKSVQFIVNDAMKYINTKKRIAFSQFSGSHHIVSPNWSPFQLINYMSSVSKGRSTYPTMTMFYENRDGFNFVLLDDLINKESLGVWSSTNREKVKNREIPEDVVDPQNNIISYKIIKNSADSLKSMMEGLYANGCMSYDNVTRTLKLTKYEYNKDFKNTSHLSRYKLNSDNFEFNNLNQRLTYIPSTSHRYESSSYVTRTNELNLGDKREFIVPYRTSILSQISARQMELEVAGDNNITVGETMDIELRNVTELPTRQMKKNRYNTKKVLVVRSTNEFTIKQHKMILRVNDDSYPDKLIATTEFEGIASNV